jgi:hypothetical protein
MPAPVNIPFLFRPECEFLAPFDSCSNGWLFYFTLGILTVVSFRNLLISAVSLLIVAILHEYSNFGIPVIESIFHWVLGSLIGAIINRKFYQRAPPFVENGVWHNITAFLEMTMILALAGVLFFAVDDTILENERPYGLAATFIMIACWLFAATFFLYCVLGIERKTHEEQMNYWKLWLHLTMVIFFAMFMAFIPDINSYLKCSITTIISGLVIIFIK